VKLVEQFALIFDEFCTVIARITFWMMEETLSDATDIPLHGERWSKDMPLDVPCYE
jgi:hypothetical protein